MASQAEIDLVVSTAGTLPELERDLARIITRAENDADAIDVNAALNSSEALRTLDAQLTAVINRVEGEADGIEVGALIDQRDTVRTLRNQINGVVNDLSRTGAVDGVQMRGVLNAVQTTREVRRQLDRVAQNLRGDTHIPITVDVNESNLRRAIQGVARLGESVARALPNVAALAARGVALGASLGGVATFAAAAVAALQNVAPAAAVGTSALLAMQLASGSLRLAMVGVEDAVKAAFDPSLKPAELEKALKGLAPEARKVVVALAGMRKELRAVQQGVQNRVFKGFDEVLRSLGRTTLPLVQRALNQSADSLNVMGRGAAAAASELATTGTLGRALDGATKALENLSGIPAKIVTAFGQLATASAPALDKLTRRLDTAFTGLSEKLGKAFETGALETAINNAVSSIGQLFRIVGNVLSGLGNIFDGLSVSGSGLFGILEKITQAFEDLTASKEFQTILTELSQTATVLVENVLPLLKEAFVQLSPVIAELGPIVREFITAIGPDAKKVVEELGPVLLDIAKVLKEQLPFAIDLTISALQLLAIVLRAAHFVMEELVLPVVRKIKEFLNSEFVQSISNTSNAIGRFSSFSSASFTNFGSVVGAVIRSAVRSITGLGGLMRNDFVNSVVTSLGRAVREFQRVPGLISDAFSALFDRMFSIGADVIRGLISGLRSQAGQLLGVARSIADEITGTIKGALGISSPSKVMIGVGEDTADGFLIGLRSVIPSIESAAQDLGRAVPSFALPNGQSLNLPTGSFAAPPVTVFIGNQVVDRYVDVRIGDAMETQNRIMTQGVRT